MGHGFWRHLVVREAKKTGEIMLIFSCNTVLTENSEAKSALKTLTEVLTKKYPNIVSVFVLENTLRADIVQGNPVLLFGSETLVDEILGYTFEIRPKSFFQVNTLGAE
jgi:tRNA/tmRNA/rRNA uracil-C5-methylase (TrmA/RlmC/RlmD family)